MHVLPLPFGLALALVRRPNPPPDRGSRTAPWSTDVSPARECIRTDSRFAAIRQRLV
jgi:hypothetical protein